MSLDKDFVAPGTRRALCTYCDSHYLSRAIVAIRRLLEFDPQSVMHVLCFDAPTARILDAWFEGRVVTIPLADVHAYEPRLPALRESRKPWEFIATHKAAFVAYVLSERGPFEWVTFIDADTAAYRSLAPVFDELGAASIGLSPSRFPDGTQHAMRYGLYNAGFLCFRDDEVARRCLQDWSDDCIAWCHAAVLPDGRFMNQGYLTQWPKRYAGVTVIHHPGVNLAPWNLGRHRICFEDGDVRVDGSPLIFFHFSGIERQRDGSWTSCHRDTSWHLSEVMERLYKPYLAEILDVEQQLMARHGLSGTGSVRCAVGGRWATAAQRLADACGRVMERMIQALLRTYARFVARPSCLRLNNGLHSLALRGLGILNHHPGGSGEEWFLRHYLAGGNGVVFDVGANVGGYTEQVLAVNPHLRIFAFEPHPLTFERLKSELGSRAGVTLVNKGVSSSSGLMDLYDYSDHDGSEHASLYPEVLSVLHGHATPSRHSVEVLTVDEYVESQGIAEIRLLKIDTEGNEFDVLLGAQQSIATKRIHMIQFEFNEMNVVSRRFFKDFWDLLAGYRLYRLLPRGLAEISRYSPLKCEVFAYQNIVAMRR
jgi:FkbM family methyltransferase